MHTLAIRRKDQRESSLVLPRRKARQKLVPTPQAFVEPLHLASTSEAVICDEVGERVVDAKDYGRVI
jgi:hypothetical protein